jgi:hypothetical protein
MLLVVKMLFRINFNAFEPVLQWLNHWWFAIVKIPGIDREPLSGHAINDHRRPVWRKEAAPDMTISNRVPDE